MKNTKWVSSDFSISRRRFVGAAMAAGGVALLPRVAMSAQSLVATTYPGAFRGSDAHRSGEPLHQEP